jgi:hypothetical protein
MAKQPAPPRKNRSPTDQPSARGGKSAKSAVLSEIERLCANHAALSGSGATQRPPAKKPPLIAPDDWASEDDRQPEPDEPYVTLPMFLFTRMVVATRFFIPDFLATPGTDAPVPDPAEIPDNLRDLPIRMAPDVLEIMVKACRIRHPDMVREVPPEALAAIGIEPPPVTTPRPVEEPNRVYFGGVLPPSPAAPVVAPPSPQPVHHKVVPLRPQDRQQSTAPPDAVADHWGSWGDDSNDWWDDDGKESTGNRLIPPPVVEPKPQPIPTTRPSAVVPAFTPASSALPSSRPRVQQKAIRIVTGWVAPLVLALALFGFAFGFGFEQKLFLSAGYWIGFTAATELTYRIIAGILFVGVVLYFLIRMTSSESIGHASVKAARALIAAILVVGVPVGALLALFGVAWGFDTELAALSWVTTFVQEKLFYQILFISIVGFIFLSICNALCERSRTNIAPQPQPSTPQPQPYGGYAINDFVETNAFGDAQLGNYDAAAQGLSDRYRKQFMPKFRE